MSGTRRYRSPDEDSARWAAVPLRPGDVVVSTRSKHGTTWLQWITAMRARAEDLAPDPGGVLVDRSAFFRRGRSGAHRDLFDDASITRYHQRAASRSAPALLRWLHREDGPVPVRSPTSG